jgi:processive 1,2-diacylglycerol beta-glucosyltransferase
MMKKYRPQAVICTQAAPAVALAAARKRGDLKVPLICAVTDFGVHSYWLHPEVDLYLVAHEDVKNELIHRGIDPDKIRCTGIPIRPAFGETHDQTEERARLRISLSKKTILLMGGSRGLGSLDDLVEALKMIPLGFQTLVVCGQNKSLHRKITDMTRGYADFHVLSYTKDLPRLMAASDILITKPGGLTCSEALAMGLPMVLTNPIPGQEERNVRFLTRHNVAMLARTPEELVVSVSNLLRYPKKLHNLRLRAKMIAKPHSAWEAARLIFDLANNQALIDNA